MSIDTILLQDAWVRLAGANFPEPHNCLRSIEFLSTTARCEVLCSLQLELESALHSAGEINALIAHADNVARVLVQHAVSQKLDFATLKLESSTLGLALLSTCVESEGHQAVIPVNQLAVFLCKLVSLSDEHYVNAEMGEVQDTLSVFTQTGTESLQHALRSPLQGAMLTLDLIREDLLVGETSLDDVDAVIKSLKTISQLLDSHSENGIPE